MKKVSGYRASVLRTLGAAGVGLLLVGCASVSVKQDRWSQEPLIPPTRVYIADYKVPSESLNVDRAGAEMEEFRAKMAQNFTAVLCEKITARIAPAMPLAEGARPAKGSWIVEGRVLRVNQGSRLLRSMIGFGAGGTKLEVETTVSAVGARGARRTIAEIETTGGSNAEPGMLTLPTPVTAGVRAVLSATLTGVSADQRRTARMITAVMAERLEAQGHELRGKKERVKGLEKPAAEGGST